MTAIAFRLQTAFGTNCLSSRVSSLLQRESPRSRVSCRLQCRKLGCICLSGYIMLQNTPPRATSASSIASSCQVTSVAVAIVCTKPFDIRCGSLRPESSFAYCNAPALSNSPSNCDFSNFHVKFHTREPSRNPPGRLLFLISNLISNSNYAGCIA